ncbi:hypothetical protein MCP_2390 [Methanocella paludicola SANAE]|uniref:Uncharacterized protein n=1 Tax=Methanocella paludicola (strain DSM 17711 / JCM 13418 / NBRC 101707 / SANAE) TaxID=304371 RepID=D1Z190_METPS|nr:hypothetical protein MCP_2390 [Methanocella paludicola SANAE]
MPIHCKLLYFINYNTKNFFLYMRFYSALIGLPRTPLIPYTSNLLPIITKLYIQLEAVFMGRGPCICPTPPKL